MNAVISLKGQLWNSKPENNKNIFIRIIDLLICNNKKGNVSDFLSESLPFVVFYKSLFNIILKKY
jgi:hypothetical protein